MLHHQASSPATFDAPEVLPLRRLKPLPKRRRTSVVAAHVSEPDDLIQPMADLLGGAESLAEELIARTESQMAMQSYYSSVLGGGTQSIESEVLDGNPSGSFSQKLGLSVVYQQLAEGLGSSGKQDEDHSEGDYIDHLQQPGNTKKRKVPANMSGSVNGRELSLTLSAEEDMMGNGVLSTVTGRSDPEVDVLVSPPSSVTQLLRKGKVSPSTLAGLQHKELLKHRKRQLATVLGALSLGDALALDQALSTHLPFVSTMFGSDSAPPKVRLSRRRGPRLARAAVAQATVTQRGAAFPTTQFTFTFPSATSDRIVATKEEVLALRSRFEAELARQAARVAKAAVEANQAALVASRASRTKRSGKILAPLQGGDQSANPSELSPSGKARGSKKKKRNALAIASNPHHRNNYVSSRLSSSGHVNSAQTTLNAQNSVGPQPARFLSAKLPSRRYKKEITTPKAQIVDPAEEWICPRCEYSLFYGDGLEYRRAIRDRKQILRRRRRAQERAAGLGATKGGGRAKAEGDSEEDDDEDDDEDDEDELAVRSVSGVGRTGEGPDGCKGTKGQSHLQTG